MLIAESKQVKTLKVWGELLVQQHSTDFWERRHRMYETQTLLTSSATLSCFKLLRFLAALKIHKKSLRHLAKHNTGILIGRRKFLGLLAH